MTTNLDWFHMTRDEEVEAVQTIKVLRAEVKVLTSRLKPHGTGYLHTTIDTINDRIDEMMVDAIAPFFESKEDEPVNRKAVTQAEMRKFYNDGPHIGARENDDGTWDMSAAARMETKPNRVRDAYLHSSKVKDDYEHTKEYYDTERNKSQSMTSPHKNVYDNAADIQNMSSDGLSNRSMKSKHGRAVQTVSEMMQEELEPLPK